MASGLQDIFEGEHIIGRIYVYGNLYFISYYFSLSFFFLLVFFFWKLTYGRYPEELTYPQHVFTLCAPVLLFNLRSCRGGSMQTFCLSTLDLHFLKYSAEKATIKNLGIGGGWDSAN